MSRDHSPRLTEASRAGCARGQGVVPHPLALFAGGVEDGELPGQSQDARHYLVCQFVQAEVGHVGNHDAQFRGQGDRNVVQSDSVAADNPALFRRGHNVRRDRPPTGHDRVGVPRVFRHLLVRAVRCDFQDGVQRIQDLKFGGQGGPPNVRDVNFELW